MEKLFTDILDEYGFKIQIRDIWISSGISNRNEGWKLHLTIIPSEAGDLIEKVAPILKETEVPFKLIRNKYLLELLNSGSMGLSQAGKFLTLYPDSDNQSLELAKKLIQLTSGFRGPAIPSDLCLGGVVYTRFGGFNPIVKRNRLGEKEFYITTPNGQLIQDKREVPFTTPDEISNPFNGFIKSNISSKRVKIKQPGNGKAKSNKLLGPGYLLTDIIRNNPKGAIYKAIDLRDQNSIDLKIIKQGRHDYLSDNYGRDIRDRLKNQEKIHKLLFDKGVPTPQVDPYFESNNNGYLPMDYIESENLENKVHSIFQRKSWRALSTKKRSQLLGFLEQILLIIKIIHKNRLVHRDLTPSNFMVSKGKIWITDFELTYRLDNSLPWFKLGTPGFMSPQQENNNPPVVEDDIFSLGCVILLMMTGIEPGRFLYAKSNNGSISLEQLIDDGVTGALVNVIEKCISYEPSERPSISEILEATKIAQNDITKLNNLTLISTDQNGFREKEIIQKGLTGILHHTAQQNGLWLSPQMENNHLNFARANNILELKRSIHSGISGVLYLLARISRFNMDSKEICNRAQRTITWLLQDNDSPDSGLPGLYFGDSGVAVSIAESIKSGLVKRDEKMDRFFEQVVRSRIDWPDITHGAAGQGLAGYYCYEILKDPKFLALPKRCAEYLIQNQKEDGSWSMPNGAEEKVGKTFTGFAHGVSGIIYFLVEHYRRNQDSRTKAAYQLGLSWLVDQMIEDKNKTVASWPYSMDSPSEEWKWWCHGSPGIALTFLRLYELTNEDSYAEIAGKALHIHPQDIRYINLSQCHGLSGIGEVYLEAYRVLGDKEWKIRADNIASVLSNFRKKVDTGVVWAVQDTNTIAADLMIGCSGIVHFFLRSFLGGREIGFPMLLGPIDSSSSESCDVKY